jgi:hypothetical protein
VSGRIYPVPVKPPSAINTWSGWPDDVRDTLRSWNGKGSSHRLSFIWYGASSVFKCTDCEEFCAVHRHGAARLDGDWLCDDCLVARARAS